MSKPVAGRIHDFTAIDIDGEFWHERVPNPYGPTTDQPAALTAYIEALLNAPGV